MAFNVTLLLVLFSLKKKKKKKKKSFKMWTAAVVIEHFNG